MPIVTVSLTERNLEVLDNLVVTLGLKGRSEAVRACIRSMEDEIRGKEELDGDIEGVLVIVHGSHHTPNLDRIRHDNRAVITTQVHSHLRNEKCLEVFLIKGSSQSLKLVLTELRKDEAVEYMRFVPS